MERSGFQIGISSNDLLWNISFHRFLWFHVLFFFSFYWFTLAPGLGRRWLAGGWNVSVSYGIKHTLNSTISTLILPHTGDVFAHWRVNEWKIATIFLFQNARHAYKWVWRIAIFILLRSFGIQFERYAIFIVRFFPLALSRHTTSPSLHLPVCQSSRSHTQFVRFSCWQFLSTIACLFEYFMQIYREYPVCVWWQQRRRRRGRRQHHFLQMCVANGLFISFTFAERQPYNKMSSKGQPEPRSTAIAKNTNQSGWKRVEWGESAGKKETRRQDWIE